jgi:L-threonylcarbamoyladenylate synthase
MVLPKHDTIPAIVTGGGATVGLRWPAHPFMRELISRCRFPLAAPSANLSNDLSPTVGEHVLRALGGRIPLIVDAGPSSVGIESTVVDLSEAPPRVLRTGMISAQQLGRALGCVIKVEQGNDSAPKSPGLLKKHYAPRARLQIARWHTDAELDRIAKELRIAPQNIHNIAH